MERRHLLKMAALSTAFFAMNRVSARGDDAVADDSEDSSNIPSLPRREFGNTGIRLSLIGMGGIVVMNVEQERANLVVAEAVERGVNYFDVAHTYGNAEERLGPALEPYRKDVFLATKTAERSREGAEADLKRSLNLLRTDYVDLYQLHALVDVERDVDSVFAKGGAMETLLEAKRAGRARFLGFTAHTVEAALAAMDRYDFDSIMFPVNFVCYSRGNFGPQLMERATRKGVARIAIKAMARQPRPKDDPTRRSGKYGNRWYQYLTDPREAELALRFALSQPVTAAIPPGDESLFRLALDFAMRFRMITPEEEEELKSLAQTLEPMFQVE